MENKIQLKENLSLAFQDKEGVILSLDKGWYLTLNESGSFIIKYIQDTKEFDIKDLITKFSNNFQISIQDAKQDINDFLEQLKQEGVLLDD